MPAPVDPELRAAAIAHAVKHGVTAAAEHCGVSQSAVSKWCKAAGVESLHSEQMAEARAAELDRRTALRESLRTKMLEKAADMLERMDEKHIDFKGNGAQQVEYPKATSSDCRAYATAAAILIDKYRLEVGEPTDRHELTGQRDRLVADGEQRALRLVADGTA